ncbi:hypothetical protein GCM10010446_44990 [Streptomyces enissocaesilis]|uniref:Uncharacterized protein n=1 Tax=Streptomyces enissocaesilis TaxID=332589 RepID=A0ABN3XIG3_9ACTN
MGPVSSAVTYGVGRIEAFRGGGGPACGARAGSIALVAEEPVKLLRAGEHVLFLKGLERGLPPPREAGGAAAVGAVRAGPRAESA